MASLTTGGARVALIALGHLLPLGLTAPQGRERAASPGGVSQVVRTRLFARIQVTQQLAEKIDSVLAVHARQGRAVDTRRRDFIRLQDSLFDARNAALRALLTAPADIREFEKNLRLTDGGRRGRPPK